MTIRNEERRERPAAVREVEPRHARCLFCARAVVRVALGPPACSADPLHPIAVGCAD